jgi:ubiquinone biosynthesis UbiH/UbiF/VisC/COQ6 family hydroxylase
MNDYDIAVIGAGVVGAACALSLQQQGFSVALIDQRMLDLPPSPLPQARVSAINNTSYHLMKTLGAWNHLDVERLTPILAMKIYGADQSAIGFDAAEFGFSELGFILENDFLIKALLNQFDITQGGLFCPATVKHVVRKDLWELELSTAAVLSAKLLVVAQGAQSNLRELLRVPSEIHFYNQKALVMNVVSKNPHRFCAYQRFLSTGPLAFLPLFNPYWSSIVWTLPTALADEYLELPEDILLQRLFGAFPDLGALTALTHVQGFELSALSAQSYCGPGFVLVGDTAHTVHPLAGQGVNLGLSDVICLNKVLKAGKDINSEVLLTQYARACQVKNKAFSSGFSLLNRLFQLEHPWFQRIIGVGLTRINKLHGVKRQLLQLARGDVWTP